MRERRRVPNRNLTNLPSGFPLSDHANFDDFTLLFCRRRRNLHSFKTHLLSYCSAYKTVCFATSSPRCRRRRALLKVLNIKQVLPRIKTPLPSSLTFLISGIQGKAVSISAFFITFLSFNHRGISTS